MISKKDNTLKFDKMGQKNIHMKSSKPVQETRHLNHSIALRTNFKYESTSHSKKST